MATYPNCGLFALRDNLVRKLLLYSSRNARDRNKSANSFTADEPNFKF